jgi:hypothetical protein
MLPNAACIHKVFPFDGISHYVRKLLVIVACFGETWADMRGVPVLYGIVKMCCALAGSRTHSVCASTTGIRSVVRTFCILMERHQRAHCKTNVCSSVTLAISVIVHELSVIGNSMELRSKEICVY